MTVNTTYNDPSHTRVLASALTRGDFFRIGESATVFKTLIADFRRADKGPEMVLCLNLDDLETETVYKGNHVELVEINEITIQVELV